MSMWWVRTTTWQRSIQPGCEISGALGLSASTKPLSLPQHATKPLSCPCAFNQFPPELPWTLSSTLSKHRSLRDKSFVSKVFLALTATPLDFSGKRGSPKLFLLSLYFIYFLSTLATAYNVILWLTSSECKCCYCLSLTNFCWQQQSKRKCGVSSRFLTTNCPLSRNTLHCDRLFANNSPAICCTVLLNAPTLLQRKQEP